MNEYISRNTIFKVLANSEPKEEDWRIDNAENYDLRKIRFLAANNVYEEIKDVLSCDRLLADVAPVVHGYWISHYRGIVEFQECSVCRKSISNSIFPYCPNCGAKMEPTVYFDEETDEPEEYERDGKPTIEL